MRSLIEIREGQGIKGWAGVGSRRGDRSLAALAVVETAKGGGRWMEREMMGLG